MKTKVKSKKQFTAVVLAAGKGTRMKSALPKVLHKLLAKPFIYYVLTELFKLDKNIKQIVIVVGYQGKKVEKATRALLPKNLKITVDFVYQPKPTGTAQAVNVALKAVKYENVLVLCADAPLITSKTIKDLLTSHSSSNSPCTMLTAYLKEGNTPGAVIRDNKGDITLIQEKAGLAPAKKTINRGHSTQEANSGMYVFDRAVLHTLLPKIKKNKRKGEYFLTDIIEMLYKRKTPAFSFILEDAQQTRGINTAEDLQEAQKILRLRILNEFIAGGVEIVDPQTTFVSPGVKIGKNSTIYPFTFIEEGAIIGRHCQLGPFLRIRGNTRIGANSQVGNFLEINRSRIGNNVKIKHFGYIGDTVVANNVNIGAGTVVANFDGRSKQKTFIGQGAFIGSDTVLVAPVKIGSNAVTGAGSVVTKNVKSKTVVVGVPAKFHKRKRG
jgi:bifunctional UDP-N-acetylglucosamine pyrophosphorylase / glucosamine-1-phosphate N-acetyltransferase